METDMQPPSGGCVLKRRSIHQQVTSSGQPPSGGCVLKLETPNAVIQKQDSRLQAAVC